jgi:hypothetical protein
MAYRASTYVKNKVNELGGAWYIYMDADLVDGDTVITSGDSIADGSTWDGSTVSGVYDNKNNIPNATSTNVIVFGRLYGDFSKFIGKTIFERNSNTVLSINQSLTSASIQYYYNINVNGVSNSYNAFQYNTRIQDSHLNGVKNNFAGGSSAHLEVDDSIINDCNFTTAGTPNQYRGCSIFTKPIPSSTNTLSNSFYIDVGVDNDLKQIFTDYDNGDFTLNPSPTYSSPITVAWGYKTEDETTDTYNSGENPFIRPVDGTTIGALGVGFAIDFKTGGLVPINDVGGTADSIESSLPASLTRDATGVYLTATSGTTSGQFNTPAMYIRDQAISSFVSQVRSLSDLNLAAGEYINCEMRFGATSAECTSATYQSLEVDTDKFIEVFGSNQATYVQLRVTLGRV